VWHSGTRRTVVKDDLLKKIKILKLHASMVIYCLVSRGTNVNFDLFGIHVCELSGKGVFCT